MIASACFVLSAIVRLAAGSVQYPPLEECPGVDNPLIEFENITIEDVVFSNGVMISGIFHVNAEVGMNPVLLISYSLSNGTALPCNESVLPCELNLCNGTTLPEKLLNNDWNNTCPIQPGTYEAHLFFSLPGDLVAAGYFGDGNIVVTLEIVDSGNVEGCVSFPVTIDLEKRKMQLLHAMVAIEDYFRRLLLKRRLAEVLIEEQMLLRRLRF